MGNSRIENRQQGVGRSQQQVIDAMNDKCVGCEWDIIENKNKNPVKGQGCNYDVAKTVQSDLGSEARKVFSHVTFA